MQWKGEHDSLVTSCDINPLLNLGLSGCDGGISYYWDIRTGKISGRLNGNSRNRVKLILVKKYFPKQALISRESECRVHSPLCLYRTYQFGQV